MCSHVSLGAITPHANSSGKRPASLSPGAAAGGFMAPDGCDRNSSWDLKRCFFPETGMQSPSSPSTSRLIAGFAEATFAATISSMGMQQQPGTVFWKGIYVPGPPGAANGVERRCYGPPWRVGERREGCTELARMRCWKNVESHAFHQALGFGEAERVVFFS